MARIKTRNIFVGDSFMVHYKCWRNKETQSARTAFGGSEATLAREPITPLMATVTLVNFETNTVIPLGEGTDEGMAEVDGNSVRFLITGDHFAQEGSYRVYTRISVDEHRTMTEVIQFRVQAIA